MDPITRIKVYDNNGILITDVSADVQSYVTSGKMCGMMGNMMGRMRNTQLEEVDHAEILNVETVIGQVNITKYSSAEKSFAT